MLPGRCEPAAFMPRFLQSFFIADWATRLNLENPVKELVAGGGIEPPTLGL